MRTIFEKAEQEMISTLIRTNNNIRKYHPIWSTLTFAIMFLPGVAIGLFAIFSLGLKNKAQECPWQQCPCWFQALLLILVLLMTCLFPIGLLLTQLVELVILCSTMCGYGDAAQILKTLSFITDIVTAFGKGAKQIPKMYLFQCRPPYPTPTPAPLKF